VALVGIEIARFDADNSVPAPWSVDTMNPLTLPARREFSRILLVALQARRLQDRGLVGVLALKLNPEGCCAHDGTLPIP